MTDRRPIKPRRRAFRPAAQPRSKTMETASQADLKRPRKGSYAERILNLLFTRGLMSPPEMESLSEGKPAAVAISRLWKSGLIEAVFPPDEGTQPTTTNRRRLVRRKWKLSPEGETLCRQWFGMVLPKKPEDPPHPAEQVLLLPPQEQPPLNANYELRGSDPTPLMQPDPERPVGPETVVDCIEEFKRRLSRITRTPVSSIHVTVRF